MKNLLRALALLLALPLTAQSATVDLEGFSVSWDDDNLVVRTVSTTSRILRNQPVPDFENQDKVFTVIQLDWKAPIVLSGLNERKFISLPVFEVNAKDGWALTDLGTYLNGSTVSTGDATITSYGNGKITFDKAASPADVEHHSGHFASGQQSLWGTSESNAREIECSASGVCVAAKSGVIDLRNTYVADFGEVGGTSTFSYRPIYPREDYSFQFITVTTERFVSSVPEPSSMLLSLFGVAMVAMRAARRA